MELSELLRPEAVRVLTEASSKKRLFQKLGETAEAAYGLRAARTVEALIERETLGPTGVGHGVALPHARMAGVERVYGLFLRLERPVDYESVDRLPIDLVFALIAPLNAGVDHLKALAAVSRTMRDPSICAKLRANDSVATLYTILTERPATQAA